MPEVTPDQPLALAPCPMLRVAAHDCHFCADARAVLERLGREHLLRVREVSIESPEGRLLATRHGILFPPGLLLDGQFVGFGRLSERKVRHLLEQRATALASQWKHA